MIPSDRLRQTTELLEPAKSVLIVLPAELDLDRVAAGLSLYLALSAAGKQASVFCLSPMTVEYSHLVGVDKIANTIGGDQGKNLVISFPYQEGSIEKVSYNIEQDTFNLVIEPREGYPLITADSIRFSQSGGGQPDLLITIGIRTSADLQRSLGAQASLIESKPVIAIDVDPEHEQYGKAELLLQSASSLSEGITDIITSLSLRLDPDIATNLLAGIIAASDTFTSPTTTAQTFETAALLSRSGARKTPVQSRPQQQPAPARMPHFPAPQTAPRQLQQRPSFPPQSYPQQQPIPPQQQQSFGKFPQQQPHQQRTQRPLQQPQPQQRPQPRQQQQQQQQQQQNETPADWLKPKIYKGSSLS